MFKFYKNPYGLHTCELIGCIITYCSVKYVVSIHTKNCLYTKPFFIPPSFLTYGHSDQIKSILIHYLDLREEVFNHELMEYLNEA